MSFRGTAAIDVLSQGVKIASRSKLNFIDGASAAVDVVDNVAQARADVTMTPSVLTNLTPTTQVRYVLLNKLIVGGVPVNTDLVSGTDYEWLVIPDAQTMWQAGYRPQFVMYGSLMNAVIFPIQFHELNADWTIGAGVWGSLYGDGGDLRAEGIGVWEYVKFTQWRERAAALLLPPTQQVAVKIRVSRMSGAALDYGIKAGFAYGVRWIIP